MSHRPFTNASDATPTVAAAACSGLTPADWVTRDDMVALTRTSKDTITRDLKKHDFQSATDAKGRILVNIGDSCRSAGCARRISPPATTRPSPPRCSAPAKSLHIMAVVQLRNPTPGREFYDARKAGGTPSLVKSGSVVCDGDPSWSCVRR